MTFSGMRWWLFLLSLLHAGFIKADDDIAHRIVSLDYCADQFVLKLAAPDRIAAVSIDSTRNFSYMRDVAEQHRKVRPSAEQVLALTPDLIVRSYGGGPNAAQFYRRLELPVIQIGFNNSIVEVQQELLRVGKLLDVAEEAEHIVEDMNRRLAAIKPGSLDQSVLYVTPGGVTSGPGSLVHDMIVAAGLTNFQTDDGWRSLPLEQLAFHQPELLATAFYGEKIEHAYYWSAARHPMIRGQLSNMRSISLESATTACGGWFLVDAVERLADGATP